MQCRGGSGVGIVDMGCSEEVERDSIIWGLCKYQIRKEGAKGDLLWMMSMM